jgi:hypothetical protein
MYTPSHNWDNNGTVPGTLVHQWNIDVDQSYYLSSHFLTEDHGIPGQNQNKKMELGTYYILEKQRKNIRNVKEKKIRFMNHT